MENIKWASCEALRNFALIGFIALCSPVVYAELDIEWLQDFDVTSEFDSNIGQASRSEDAIETGSIGANYSLLSNIELGGKQAVTLKVFLEADRIDRVEDLSTKSAGIQFIYRWQRTLGYLEPFYQFNTSIQVDEYGVDQRDSTVSRTQFFVTKRFSDSISLVLGAEHFLRDSDGTVFDMKHDRLFLNMDYILTPLTTIYGSYGFRKGDISSSTRVTACDGSPVLGIFPLIATAEERERDNAFGASHCGVWTAYRLDAETHAGSVGINLGFGKSSAIDFSVNYADSSTKYDIEYERTIFRLSYLVRL